MSMLDWAEFEVNIACNYNASADDDNSWRSYFQGCYRSALNAYRSLMQDDHSNLSIVFTQYVLNRLIQGLPLTPIEDTVDSWQLCPELGSESRGVVYQHKRYTALFKYVKDNGDITYSDVHRTIFHPSDELRPCHLGLANDIVDNLYPIKFPYTPTTESYVVHGDKFSYYGKDDEFDTVGIIYIHTPEGKEIGVHRYYKEVDNQWFEIEEFEYNRRKLAVTT